MYHNGGVDATIASEADTTVQPMEVQPVKLIDALVVKRDELLRSLKAVDEELADIHNELNLRLERTKAKRRPLEEALVHLEALLKVEGWTLPADRQEATVLATGGKVPADAAYELLAQEGKPLHYRELSQRLVERGVTLTGKDPAATLLSQMSRDSRFKRSPDRGTYGLASWKMRGSKKRKSKKQSIAR